MLVDTVTDIELLQEISATLTSINSTLDMLAPYIISFVVISVGFAIFNNFRNLFRG